MVGTCKVRNSYSGGGGSGGGNESRCGGREVVTRGSKSCEYNMGSLIAWDCCCYWLEVTEANT